MVFALKVQDGCSTSGLWVHSGQNEEGSDLEEGMVPSLGNKNFPGKIPAAEAYSLIE